MSEMQIQPATMASTMEAYRKEARFRAVCQSIVAQEMLAATRDLDGVENEPWRAREVCDRIAIGVAARVLQTIYENDAEIKAWKAISERVTATALEIANLSPMLVIRGA